MDLFEPFCRFHQYFYEHQYKNREKNLKCHNRDNLFCYKTIYWAIFPKKKKPLCIFNPKVEKHTNTPLVCDLCWALTIHSRHVMNQVLSLMRLAKDSRVKFSVSQLHTHTHTHTYSRCSNSLLKNQLQNFTSSYLIIKDGSESHIIEFILEPSDDTRWWMSSFFMEKWHFWVTSREFICF